MTPKGRYSDRATAYCRRVVSGEELASKWIKLACERHLNDLNAVGSRWIYDAAKVNKACSLIETLTLSNGNLFVLSEWQIWIIASLLGWVDEAGLRKYIEALILVPKGNGKSPLAAALGLWFAFFDGRKSAEVYCGALTLPQAYEVFEPARQFVENHKGFSRAGITAQKRSIFSNTNSRFVPVVGKGRHGSRPYLAILDELHQSTTDDLYGTFKTGCNKTINSLMLVISTAGVAASDNPCYRLQQQAEKALDGSLINDRLFAAIYCADESVEWNSDEALRMANPNLGISNDAEKLRIALGEACSNPATQNNTKAMHLNIWSSASAAWMNMASWAKCHDPELTDESVKHLPCWIGSDLASKLDISACVRLFRDDSQGDRPHYYAFTRTYLPETRVNAPEFTHYQMWSKQGHLTATPGSSMDYATIEADALSDIATYQVREIAYDARYADETSQRISEQSGIPRVETPPSPAVLSPAMKELEAAVADGRFHHDGDPVLAWCMSNVLTRETAAGNYTMPEKQRQEAKIDGAVALFIAMARARLAEPPEPTPGFFMLI
jgi:phage terminase large subunit-like protein